MAIRYINTASSAGGDGTTNATSGANRAYVSKNEWEAARQASLTEVEEVICEGTTADTTAVIIDGWTTSASFYIDAHTTAANQHDGKWNTGKYRLSVGHAIALDVKEQYVRFSGIEFSSNFNYATSGSIILVNPTGGGACDIRFVKDIVREVSTSYAEGGILLEYVGGLGSTSKVYIINSIIYDISKAIGLGGIADAGAYSVYAYNVTAHNCRYGFRQTVSTFLAKNCGAAASITAGFNGTITQTTCSSTTPTFVNEGADDFHLASGDTTWKDAGTDLSGDADYPFSDDVDGDARSGSWDIGADEFVAAGGGANWLKQGYWWEMHRGGR